MTGGLSGHFKLRVRLGSLTSCTAARPMCQRRREACSATGGPSSQVELLRILVSILLLCIRTPVRQCRKVCHTLTGSLSSHIKVLGFILDSSILCTAARCMRQRCRLQAQQPAVWAVATVPAWTSAT